MEFEGTKYILEVNRVEKSPIRTLCLFLLTHHIDAVAEVDTSESYDDFYEKYV